MTQFDSDRAADIWGGVLNKLILGISHHISNRVSTLAGVSDILVGDPHTASPVLCALSDEVVKLEEVVRLFRLLVVPDESEEAAEPIRLVKDAISLAGLHPDLGGVVYTTAGGGEAPPILARPVALTHEILIALTLAASDSKDGSVLVELYADGDGVSIVAGRYAVSARNLTAARQATA